MSNAVSAWGKTGKDTSKILAWLGRMIEHNKKPGHGILYSTHILEEDRVAKQAAARKQVAAKRAAARLKRP